MGEIVMGSDSYQRSNGSIMTAEEKAEYLIKTGYPVPTDDFDELVNMIKKSEEKAETVATQP